MDKKALIQQITQDGKNYHYYSIPLAEKAGLGDFHLLPNSLKILLENLLRHYDDNTVTKADINAMCF